MKEKKLSYAKYNRKFVENKAFTLIELLAIIVILAIIAVITVPIILNVIENAKKGAAQNSAYGYIDALKKQIVMNEIETQEQKKFDGVYTVNENTIINGSTIITINVNGEKPSEGCIVIGNSKVTSYSLKIGDYVVNKKNGIEPEEEVIKGGTIASCSESTSNETANANYVSPEQIWDCQRSPSMPTEGMNFTISGLNKPLDKNWMSWNPQDGRYLKVAFSNNKARLDEYDASGNKIGEFSDEGTLYLLDRERHIYFFTGSGLGYVFCTDPVEAENFYDNNGGSFPYSGIEIVENFEE